MIGQCGGLSTIYYVTRDDTITANTDPRGVANMACIPSVAIGQCLGRWQTYHVTLTSYRPVAVISASESTMWPVYQSAWSLVQCFEMARPFTAALYSNSLVVFAVVLMTRPFTAALYSNSLVVFAVVISPTIASDSPGLTTSSQGNHILNENSLLESSPGCQTHMYDSVYIGILRRLFKSQLVL